MLFAATLNEPNKLTSTICCNTKRTNTEFTLLQMPAADAETSATCLQKRLQHAATEAEMHATHNQRLVQHTAMLAQHAATPLQHIASCNN